MVAFAMCLFGVSGSLPLASSLGEPPIEGKNPVLDLAIVSSFHTSLGDLCIHRTINVDYDGPLGARIKRPREVGNSASTYYSWSVLHQESEDSLPHVLFHINISDKEDRGATYSCRIKEKAVFIAITKVVKAPDDAIFKDSPYEELRTVTLNELIKKMKWTKTKR
jgi:hypothetical protein